MKQGQQDPNKLQLVLGFYMLVLGAEGIVAKRRDWPYRSGRCSDWAKVKNPDISPVSEGVCLSQKVVLRFRRADVSPRAV